MKGKKHSELDSPTFFSGACEKCGEVYEAHSKTDDLEGITFKCKKVTCKGRVTLGVGQAKSAADPITVPDDIEPSGTPRRYC